MSKQELKKWLRKMQLYWVLHGGIKKWDGVKICQDTCKQLEYCKSVSRSDAKRLLVTPDLKTMYFGKWGDWATCWCAEWIKNV